MGCLESKEQGSKLSAERQASSHSGASSTSAEPRKTRHSDNLELNHTVQPPKEDAVVTSGKAATSKPGYGQLSLGGGVAVPPPEELSRPSAPSSGGRGGGSAPNQGNVAYVELNLNNTVDEPAPSDGAAAVPAATAAAAAPVGGGGKAHARGPSVGAPSTTQYTELRPEGAGDTAVGTHAHGGYSELKMD